MRPGRLLLYWMTKTLISFVIGIWALVTSLTPAEPGSHWGAFVAIAGAGVNLWHYYLL